MGGRLRLVTGWTLLVGAVGIFIDAWASWSLDFASPPWLLSIVTPGGPGEGSIGLIPAYLGGTAGMIGLVVVLYRRSGRWPALACAAGVAGVLTFWYSYPDRATVGGMGSVVIGLALLSWPDWGKFASPLWVASGVLGIPELVRPGINWGPIAGFTLAGAALALTGAFVLWGQTVAGRQTVRTPHASASSPG